MSPPQAPSITRLGHLYRFLSSKIDTPSRTQYNEAMASPVPALPALAEPFTEETLGRILAPAGLADLPAAVRSTQRMARLPGAVPALGPILGQLAAALSS